MNETDPGACTSSYSDRSAAKVTSIVARIVSYLQKCVSQYDPGDEPTTFASGARKGIDPRRAGRDAIPRWNSPITRDSQRNNRSGCI